MCSLQYVQIVAKALHLQCVVRIFFILLYCNFCRQKHICSFMIYGLHGYDNNEQHIMSYNYSTVHAQIHQSISSVWEMYNRCNILRPSLSISPIGKQRDNLFSIFFVRGYHFFFPLRDTNFTQNGISTFLFADPF